MNNWLFLSLLLAHVIGDFYLQNDKYCAQKEERKFKSWFLYVHSLIIGVVSWAVVPIYEFRFCRYDKTDCFILPNDNEYDCKNAL